MLLSFVFMHVVIKTMPYIHIHRYKYSYLITQTLCRFPLFIKSQLWNVLDVATDFELTMQKVGDWKRAANHYVSDNRLSISNDWQLLCGENRFFFLKMDEWIIFSIAVIYHLYRWLTHRLYDALTHLN